VLLVITMSDSLLNDLSKFKDAYYNENKTNIFQKKAQKYEVAKAITSKFDINILLQKTVYIIPNTNKIFINYPLFKKFAQPDNYELFVKYVQNIVSVVIEKNGSFECHLNFESFTISAAERYKGIINTFNECEIGYTDYMDAIYVYNPPTIIETISKILLSLIDQTTKKKIQLVNKSDGEHILASFLNHSFRKEL